MPDSRDIYREWKRNLKQDAKEVGNFRASEWDSVEDLDYHYDQFLVDLAMSLEENETLDPSKWLNLAKEDVAKIKDKFIDKFGIEGESKSFVQSGTLWGINFIEPDEYPSAIKRKKLWTSLPELVDYLIEVPYPAGIEQVFNDDGSVRGYYLWVEK